MRKAFFGFALASIVTTTARASEWHLIATNESGWLFADAQSIRPSGNRRLVWIDNFQKTHPDKAFESKTQFIVDCDAHTSGATSFIDYRRNGETITSQSVAYPTMNPTAPDTFGEQIERFACGSVDDDAWKTTFGKPIGDPKNAFIGLMVVEKNAAKWAGQAPTAKPRKKP